MRILTVSPDQYERYRSFLKQMHRLRATVFGGRLEWDVSIIAGEERDQYDNFMPSYLLAITDSGRVAGCVRLLPACGPTMLEQTFSQLLEMGSLAAHSGMVESSRFCVDTSLVSRRDASQLHLATLTLFAGIIEWSMASGYTEIVTATDLRFERILKRAGWPMRRLGEPTAIGNTIAIAGRLPADRASFEQVCPPGYYSIPRIDVAAIRSAA
ncbi:acyl-homoserine-lactone synthase (plasmid) [Agrobacterium tumefaciens]|uniref:Acyl-homoserine-lactone synthase n=2 Tax=Rhizobium/Agrobacterium group TaxID=227290 RepID=A0A2Z2PI01_AGRTU|nr:MULTISPECIES: acyl-homoserine-lactone synthase [Rhizobium/Agrobacterium group]ASK41032.1 autoinducer synthesis protein [Rhizobium rhizogenes]ASK41202.1 autoinducer synthesis protein [Agrobacterium tumefaciens]ASK41837.1 autoinducer synthesis protein [Agrobacterium tumefaciens]MDJ1637416.1 acyl-homoserine-lactone synthase [Rhizobium rhizogenes]MDR5010988.1 acyl-homoserine-lactone synthase [Agrobacterium tumefaciens]